MTANHLTMADSVRLRDCIAHPTLQIDEPNTIDDNVCLGAVDEDADDTSAANNQHHPQPMHYCHRKCQSVHPGSISNLCSATLGAGALSLPYAISLTGIVVGVLLLIVSAYLTIISVDVIIDACVKTRLFKYEDVAERLVGRRAGRVLEASLLIFCFGTSVVYIMAVGDILYEGVQAIELDSEHTDNSRRKIMISFWVLVMFPLSLQRHMGALERFSSLGVLSILALVLAAVIHSLIHSQLFGGDGYTQHQQRTDMNSMLWPDSFWDIIKACPIIIFAFSCQINVCALYEELPPAGYTPSGTLNHTMPMLKSKQKAMKRITRNSVLLCMTFYICIGLFGFLDFGHETSDNILKNYCIQKTRDTLIIVPSAFFAVAIVVAFPFNILPARVTMKLILERLRRRRRCRRCHHFFSSIACDNCFLPWSGSRENSQIGRSLESLVDSGNEHAIATDPLLGDDRFGDRPILIPHLSLEASMIDKDDQCSPESPPLEHFLLTLLLSGSALIVALLIPGISIVFGIMGGSAASVIAFILPGLFLKEIRGTSREVLPFLLVWGGIVIGVLSTGITIYGLFIPRNGAGVSTCGNHNTTNAGI